jgi:hypothetical protein
VHGRLGREDAKRLAVSSAKAVLRTRVLVAPSTTPLAPAVSVYVALRLAKARGRVPRGPRSHHHPHRGIGQRIPLAAARERSQPANGILTRPVLGGLHHAYCAAA